MRVLTANFHGTELYGVRVGDKVFVAPKPIVEALMLDWPSQLKRIKRDAVLAEGMVVMTIPSEGGPQETVGLRLDLIPGWLFTISTLRVKDPNIREKIVLYRRECFAALSEHFLGKRKPKNGPDAYDRMSLKLANEARLLFGKVAGAEVWLLRGLDRTPAMDEMFRQIDMFRKRAKDGDMPPKPASGAEPAQIASPSKPGGEDHNEI